jgi:hypothetical protein
MQKIKLLLICRTIACIRWKKQPKTMQPGNASVIPTIIIYNTKQKNEKTERENWNKINKTGTKNKREKEERKKKLKRMKEAERKKWKRVEKLPRYNALSKSHLQYSGRHCPCVILLIVSINSL